MAAAKTLTPEQRRERARKAAVARTSIDYHINAIAAGRPKLTAEQIAKLRPLLDGGAK